ncbi:hypothetical protein [Ornithinimicrobium faecis]|uniref:hypothetical protein n=1 Tax=Ornithinimicrobium faecis TaxID=2934158 RepID=UPI002117C78C|nr:hypothetical protein [Ornithinimicrobium sp. HY1745]
MAVKPLTALGAPALRAEAELAGDAATETMAEATVQAARSHLGEAVQRQQAAAQAHLERIARAGK